MRSVRGLVLVGLAVTVLGVLGLSLISAQLRSEKNFLLSTDEVDYGKTPFIDPNANPQVRSAVEAIRTGSNPQRLSVLMYSEEPFNLDAYRQCPEDYLNIAEPGRAFQPAQPGPGVPRLQPNSRPFHQIAQSQSVELSVRGVPHTPVTFTSTDLGIFENQLTTMTVEADDEGIARVSMIATPGTINDVNILAASPVTSGQVKFIVHVTKQKRFET